MIYKNVEIHNIAEIIKNDDGSISWCRIPKKCVDALEKEVGKKMAYNCTGVELRFVLKGDKVTIRMCDYHDNPKDFNTFHVYRGGIQGGCTDHEMHRHVTNEVQDFVIEKSQNPETLKRVTEMCGMDWDSEVIRVIFDRGRFKIFDIIGDVEPPKKEQTPKRTMLCYGSSITHGSNSIDASHSWVSVLAHNLNMDARNLGMAGSCAMEPDVAEYIANEGMSGKWDVALLELGVNVIDWEEEKIYSRVENILTKVAGKNPEKPVFVISPFHRWREAFFEEDNAPNWRRIIEEIVGRLGYKNLTYINGLDVIDNVSWISADEVHPNIYGVGHIADVLTQIIKDKI